jgi:hypothetical protein
VLEQVGFFVVFLFRDKGLALCQEGLVFFL